MSRERYSPLLCHVALMGCALGVAATLYLLDGLTGYPAGTVSHTGIAAVAILAAAYFLYIFSSEAKRIPRLGIALWFLVLLVLLVEIALGLLPPTARDELTHHLAIPRAYSKAGRIFEIPFAPYSYYPMLLDMLYIPWVRWHWDSVPKLIHGLYGFSTGLLLLAYLSRRLSPVYGLLGLLFFITTPAILRLGHWAYVDLGVVFYSTSSLLCLARWLEDPRGKRWLLLAGLSAGFALATKPSGFVAVLIIGLWTVFSLGRLQKASFRERTLDFFLFVLLAAIPLSPWAVKNAIWTGNPFPFLPFLGGWFPTATGTYFGEDGGLGIFAMRALLYGENGWQIAALPLRLFFFGQDDAPQFFDGVLNPMLILFLPWSFKGKWGDEKRLFFAFSSLYLLYAVFLVEMRIRYILPIIPPLVILLVYGIHNLYLRIARPAWLVAAVLLLLSANGIYLWNHVRAVSPWNYLQGRETREAYLTRMLPDYPAIQYVNQVLPAATKIYFLSTGRRVYYCERDYFHDPGNNPWTLTRAIRTVEDPQALRLVLQKMGVTHLLVREDLLQRFLKDNLLPERLELWAAFHREHLRELFHERGYSVYQIRG